MPDPGHESELRALARRHVEAVKGFYIHFAIFVMVIGVLAGVDYETGEGWWVQWPLLGWGIGVAAHAIGVFGRAPAALADWEERKIAATAARLGAERHGEGPARQGPTSPDGFDVPPRR